MATSASEEQVTLRILVDEEKNRVVFVQAGKDFVDVLLSFLTLPLGTIIRLVGKESDMKKVSVGSLSSLYESVANLEEKHFWTETCKEMLLHPRNSMEGYCQNLKLNIDDTEKIKYYVCENLECSRKSSGGLLSTFRNKRCKCGKLMNRVIFHRSQPANGKIHEGGFVPEMATFIILDDLKVMPDNFQTTVCLPMNLGYDDFDAFKQVIVNVTKNEIADLLKCSLISKTPLTDIFLRKKQFLENTQPRTVLDFDIGVLNVSKNGPLCVMRPRQNGCNGRHYRNRPRNSRNGTVITTSSQPRFKTLGVLNGNVGENSGNIMKFKVMLRKSNSKILFALAEEDFVDFLFSFLTFPLGGVEQMLKGNSCLGSIDNLHKSMVDLDGYRFLMSNDLKDKLVKSRLAHQFKLYNQMLPIDEVPTSYYYCYSNLDSKGRVSGYLTVAQDYRRDSCGTNNEEVYAPLSYLEPQSSTGETYSSYGRRGFAKKPSLYMVTDDLIVTPSSSISAISFLTKLRIPPQDLEERVICIGKEEGLSILKASLISSSALSNGLRQYIKPIKEENIPN